MKASKDEVDEQILNATCGAMFFGVPSRGMNIDSLRPMVSGQPNETFLINLGRDSELLTMKSERFCKAFRSRDSKVLSFYETEQSPTAVPVCFPRVCMARYTHSIWLTASGRNR